MTRRQPSRGGWSRLHDSGNAEAYTRKTLYHLQVSWWRRRRVAESMPGDLPEPRGDDSAPDHAQQTTLRGRTTSVIRPLRCPDAAGVSGAR